MPRSSRNSSRAPTGGLETPEVSTVVMGDTLVVTVTFPDGGVPEESKIFWMYDRGPDGSSWYLYDLIPEENWAIMNGSGSTWTASIPLDSGHASIDLITTHTVTVNGRIIPISAPYTRVTLARAVPFLSPPAIWLLASVLAAWGTSLIRLKRDAALPDSPRTPHRRRSSH